MWRILAISVVTVSLLGALFVANAAGPGGVWPTNTVYGAFGHLPMNE